VLELSQDHLGQGACATTKASDPANLLCGARSLRGCAIIVTMGMESGGQHRLEPGDADDASRLLFRTGVAFVLLIAASEVKFRLRSPQAALHSSVDTQVAIELLLWGAVGLWVLRRRAPGFLRSSGGPGRPRTRMSPRSGSALQALRGVTVLAVVSSLYGGLNVAVVRAFQIGVLVEFTVLTALVLHRWPQAWEALLRGLRAALVVLIMAMTAVSLFISPPFYDPGTHVRRYRWLQMHPNATASVLGLTVVVLSAELIPRLIRQEPVFAHRPGLVVAVLLSGTLLLMTRSRGAAAGVVVAVLLMAAVNAHRRLRLTIAATLAAGMCVIVLDPRLLLSSAVTRGQTVSDLTGLSGRSAIFSVASHLVAQRPIQGYGYLATRGIFLTRIPWAGESHNFLVEILVSTGLVGLCVYANLLWRWHRDARSAHGLGDDETRSRVSLSVGLIAFILLFGFVDASFAGPPGVGPVTLCLAVLLVSVVKSAATPFRDRVVVPTSLGHPTIAR
jgi:O-antigen ligase